ncbi:IS21 family transposase [Methylosinus sp. PW1]|uniref:IS21 family transposase n=1 Tax=Methylosinus sp. PW1 TaxID=107636 RepID=UPI0009FB9A06|nr:IS21 family transposase [Methylosinus sp. PW1]
MTSRTRHQNQEAAAANAGFSARTARRIDKDPRLPSQKKQPRSWRTRADPLADIWPRVLEMLAVPGVMAVTIFEDLQDELGPEVFPDSVRRTLERRIAKWRALHGADKEVFFPQRHDAGRQALSDFTVADSLDVTIAGEPFPHRLYHFRLACSGWEHVRVILGGESFSAVAEGLQDALWKLGGVPREHRTDSLSAAFKNLDRSAQLDFTKRYDDLCRHYGMEATRNNPGVANENGSIEAANGHIKVRLDQRLRRRGSRDFDSVEAYRAFVAGVCDRYNARRAEAVVAERATLKTLPRRRTTDFATVSAKVTRNSTINVDRVLYSVPSRLIGQKIEVRLFDDRLECFLGPDPVMRMTRVRTDRARGHAIDYHHLIGTLRRKPQALRYLVYREALFPRAAYTRAWAALDAALPQRDACRTMVGLLVLASTREAIEIALAERLDAILDAGKLPDIAKLEEEFVSKPRPSSDVVIPEPDLQAYDRLLPSACEARP